MYNFVLVTFDNQESAPITLTVVEKDHANKDINAYIFDAKWEFPNDFVRALFGQTIFAAAPSDKEGIKLLHAHLRGLALDASFIF